MNILFVCTGNVSRSFLAEMLLKNEVKQHHLKNIEVSSAGVSAYPGIPADPEMVNYLSKIGVPYENHEARAITKDDVDQADLILVMEKAHFEIIKSEWPQIEHKMELLGKYIAPDQAEDDVIDPYGRSAYYYRLAQSQITLAIRSLMKRLLSDIKKK
jgi:protein-tyrosine-phosphatase